MSERERPMWKQGLAADRSGLHYPSDLVLLCHKVRCLHCDNVVTRATTNFRLIVAIQLQTWGPERRIPGLITFAWNKLREQAWWDELLRGNRLSLGDQESVSCDAQRA
jgi:hypothetical protein